MHKTRAPRTNKEHYFLFLIYTCFFQGIFNDVQRAPKLPSKAPREVKELVSLVLVKLIDFEVQPPSFILCD